MVCHGIPGDKVLREGDVVNIDVTPILDGWYGDSSRMYPVGKIGVKAQRLIDVTYESLMKAIEIVKPGTTLGDIGHIIQSFVEGNRFSVVRDFCGHGVGACFHTPPSVLHYGNPGEGLALARRDDLHDRADGECRAPGDEDPVGRVDGGDKGPLDERPVRTYAGCYRRWRRDITLSPKG